jgi:hypothetical protein
MMIRFPGPNPNSKAAAIVFFLLLTRHSFRFDFKRAMTSVFVMLPRIERLG